MGCGAGAFVDAPSGEDAHLGTKESRNPGKETSNNNLSSSVTRSVSPFLLSWVPNFLSPERGFRYCRSLHDRDSRPVPGGSPPRHVTPKSESPKCGAIGMRHTSSEIPSHPPNPVNPVS